MVVLPVTKIYLFKGDNRDVGTRLGSGVFVLNYECISQIFSVELEQINTGWYINSKKHSDTVKIKAVSRALSNIFDGTLTFL